MGFHISEGEIEVIDFKLGWKAWYLFIGSLDLIMGFPLVNRRFLPGIETESSLAYRFSASKDNATPRRSDASKITAHLKNY